MSQTQCPQGHFYTPAYEGDQSCPHCATIKKNLFETEAVYATVDANEVIDNKNSKPISADTSPRSRVGCGTKTVGIYSDERECPVAPVVGWLVCEQGPSRGKDFRIISGNNFIGRDADSSHIHIQDDESVSRFKHAAIIYEPKTRTFILMMGDSSGLVYHNEALVTSPVTLASFDHIEVGNSTLIFLPFCGSEYSWESTKA